MTALVLPIVGILVCLLFQGFFSGSEIGIVSADRLAMKARADKGDRGARMVLEYLERPERLLGTCLLGTNLCVVTSATILTHLLDRWVGGNATLATTLVLTPLVLLFAEMTPKSVYEHHANRLAPVIVYPLRAASFLLYPAVAVIEAISRLVLLLTRAPSSVTERPVRREEIFRLLDAVEEEDLEKGELDLIRKVFQFGDTTVEEAMVPLIQVSAIPVETSVREAASRMVETGFSRLPVFQGRIDHIVGAVTHRDLLFAPDPDAPLTSCLRQVTFVPETKRLDALLAELRAERQRFAVVVDEYGGAVGIISVEDVLEEIVGEIEDEFDDDDVAIHRVGEHQWNVEGRVEREPLESHLGLILPDGAFETLAGFLLTRFGRIPDVGAQNSWNGWKFVVLRATDRAILEVSVTRTPPPA